MLFQGIFPVRTLTKNNKAHHDSVARLIGVSDGIYLL